MDDAADKQRRNPAEAARLREDVGEVGAHEQDRDLVDAAVERGAAAHGGQLEALQDKGGREGERDPELRVFNPGGGGGGGGGGHRVTVSQKGGRERGGGGGGSRRERIRGREGRGRALLLTAMEPKKM